MTSGDVIALSIFLGPLLVVWFVLSPFGRRHWRYIVPSILAGGILIRVLFRLSRHHDSLWAFLGR